MITLHNRNRLLTLSLAMRLLLRLEYEQHCCTKSVTV